MSIADDVIQLKSTVSKLSTTVMDMTKASVDNLKKVGQYNQSLANNLKNYKSTKPDNLFNKIPQKTQFELITKLRPNIEKPELLQQQEKLPLSYKKNIQQYQQNFNQNYSQNVQTQYLNTEVIKNITNDNNDIVNTQFDYNKYNLPPITN